MANMEKLLIFLAFLNPIIIMNLIGYLENGCLAERLSEIIVKNYYIYFMVEWQSG